jgi:hypothetical protein
MRSVVVVFPASTWAMIPMLRMSARGVVRGIAKFRLFSGSWIGETRSKGDFGAANNREEWGNLLGRVAAIGVGTEVLSFQRLKGVVDAGLSELFA